MLGPSAKVYPREMHKTSRICLYAKVSTPKVVGTLKSALCESSYKMTTRSMYRTLQLSAELRFPNIFVIALALAHQRVLPIFVSFFSFFEPIFALRNYSQCVIRLWEALKKFAAKFNRLKKHIAGTTELVVSLKTRLREWT